MTIKKRNCIVLKTVKRTHPAAALAFIAIGLFTPAAQALTYTFSQSYACSYNCDGTLDVMGIIETDGTLGAIDFENIIDFELSFNSNLYDPVIINTTNGELIGNGPLNLMATAEAISFDLNGTDDPSDGQYIQLIFQGGDFRNNVFGSFSFSGGGEDGDPSQLRVSHNNSPDNPLAWRDTPTAVVFPFEGKGGRFELASSREGSDPAASVPEPSLIFGFITLGGLMLGSKRKSKR
ncbi:MAG: PEP-CTERM sorting domain-containing protein [Trichodesmium sp.]